MAKRSKFGRDADQMLTRLLDPTDAGSSQERRIGFREAVHHEIELEVFEKDDDQVTRFTLASNAEARNISEVSVIFSGLPFRLSYRNPERQQNFCSSRPSKANQGLSSGRTFCRCQRAAQTTPGSKTNGQNGITKGEKGSKKEYCSFAASAGPGPIIPVRSMQIPMY